MQTIRKYHWLIPVFLLLLMALVVLVSPEERTLGNRIKIVYVHVAFVWTGLAGILLTGLLSFTVFWKPFARRLEKLLPILSLTALTCFAIGFILSLLAAQINWGGILWDDPRAISSLRILSVAIIVQVLSLMLTHLYFRAGLYILLMGFTAWSGTNMSSAIHPDNPIFSSDSSSFGIAVLSLVGLVLLMALWFITMQYHQLRK